ncbi:MAG: hypothetical protein IJ506_05640 [Clostridia bacterium]|nr:hypothetical protein [Clostridia bacterium]
MRKTKSGRNLCLAFAWLTFCLSLLLLHINQKSFANAEDASSAFVGVGLDHSDDFTLEPLDEAQATDGGNAFTYEGLRDFGGITSCVGDPNAMGEGYITYKLNAPDGQVIDSLSVTAFGRVCYYLQNETHKANSKLVVSVSETADGEFTAVATVNADMSGYKNHSFDLSEKTKGKEVAFVRFDLSGYGDSWVCLQAINFEGSASYVGYENISFQIENRDEGNVVSVGDTVEVKKATTTRGEPVASVTSPSGEPVALSEGAFTVNEAGRYEVKYVVSEETRVYGDSYYLYAVEDAATSLLAEKKADEQTGEETWDKTALKDPANAYVTSEYDGAVTANYYLLPVDFSDRFNFLFDLELQEGESVDIALTGTAGEVNFSTQDKEGFYFTLTFHRETDALGEALCAKVMMRGYFKYLAKDEATGETGVKLVSLGEYTFDGEEVYDGDTIVGVSGRHGLGFDRRSASEGNADGVYIYFDGTEYGGGPTTTSVYLSEFMQNNTVYLSYRVKKAEFAVETVTLSDVKFPIWKMINEETVNKENYELFAGEAAEYLNYLILKGETGASAAFKNPLEFGKIVYLTFDMQSGTAEALKDGAKIEFMLSASKAAADFKEKTAAGLYFTLQMEESEAVLYAYYHDGTELKELESVNLGERSSRKSEYVITVERLIGTEEETVKDTGLYIEIDGDEVAELDLEKDGIDLSHIVNADGQTYTACRVENAEAKLYALGVSAEFNQNGLVGDDYVLPTVATVDSIDGETEYTVKVTDPNGLTVEVFEREDGKRAFSLVYEGRYTVAYSTKDFTGNKSETVKRVTAKLKEGAPVLDVAEPDPYGRAGVTLEIPEAEVTVKGKEAKLPVTVTIVNPFGEKMHLSGDKFTPFEIGTYTAEYSVSNEVGTTKKYFEIQIKANVAAEDSYDDILQAENWTFADGVSGAENTKNGVYLYENGYSVLPFEMKRGVEVTVDLTSLAVKENAADPESTVDCWVSVGFGCSPVIGGFGTPQPGFVYFMLYKAVENGTETYKLNANFCNSSGLSMGLFSEDIGSEGKAVLSIQKLTGSTMYTDNVDIYVNHKKIEYGTEKLVVFSQIVDNEEFMYLSFFAYGTNGSMPARDFKGATIEDVFVCDQAAPTISYSSKLVEKAKLGATVKLPSVTIKDDLDPSFRSSIGLYAPDGTKLDHEAESFKADQLGAYYLVVKAYDKSGNRVVEIKEIVVTAADEGCASVLSYPAYLTAAFAITAFAIALRKKNEKDKKEA